MAGRAQKQAEGVDVSRRRQPRKAEAARIREGIMRGRALFATLQALGWPVDSPAWKQREVEAARDRAYERFVPRGLHYQVKYPAWRTYEALRAERRRRLFG